MKTRKSIELMMADAFARHGAKVEVTFISNEEFNIHTEDAASMETAKDLLALAGHKPTGEHFDSDCGYFAWFAF